MSRDTKVAVCKNPTAAERRIKRVWSSGMELVSKGPEMHRVAGCYRYPWMSAMRTGPDWLRVIASEIRPGRLKVVVYAELNSLTDALAKRLRDR
jgi:hypothetical protein